MPARRRPGKMTMWMHTYLFHRAEEKEEKAAKEEVVGGIREYVEAHGTVRLDDDGNEITGNIEYLLPEPMEVAGKKYYGMELRKKTNIHFDEDAAMKLAAAKGWDDEEVGHYVYVVDQDAFFVKNQQGKLTDDELDALLIESDPDYALWPIENPRDDARLQGHDHDD